jgi:hypothetical protein
MSHDTAVRIHSLIAQVIGCLAGKLGMQGEAAARQRIERTTATPIEGQKAARFAGSRTSDIRSFDDSDIDAAPGQKIGGASPDHAAAANHDMHVCCSPKDYH